MIYTRTLLHTDECLGVWSNGTIATSSVKPKKHEENPISGAFRPPRISYEVTRD
jgi:hypothetical protein